MSLQNDLLQEAIAKYGNPEIMNSDQGSQFTGFEWTQALKDVGEKYPCLAVILQITGR